MRVVILAGGKGSRLGPLTDRLPKPMVEIGGTPILVHIMRSYAAAGFRDFVVALGHRGEVVRDHFEADPGAGIVAGREGGPDADWSVRLVDTGEETGTGGRLTRLAPLLDETFMLTWGDGLSDVDPRELVSFHRAHGALATVTAVHPPPRFGRLELEGDRVVSFAEKAPVPELWINGAFFVLEPEVIDYVEDDATMLEEAPLERLASEGELRAFRHEGFWQCMDTPADRERLEALWSAGAAPWRPVEVH